MSSLINIIVINTNIGIFYHFQYLYCISEIPLFILKFKWFIVRPFIARNPASPNNGSIRAFSRLLVQKLSVTSQLTLTFSYVDFLAQMTQHRPPIAQLSLIYICVQQKECLDSTSQYIYFTLKQRSSSYNACPSVRPSIRLYTSGCHQAVCVRVCIKSI